MNTLFFLVAEFDTADIPLDKVAQKYLAISPNEARRKASLQALPFAVFRAGGQKTPWLVRAADLADYLDKQVDMHRKLWERMQIAS